MCHGVHNVARIKSIQPVFWNLVGKDKQTKTTQIIL